MHHYRGYQWNSHLSIGLFVCKVDTVRKTKVRKNILNMFPVLKWYCIQEMVRYFKYNITLYYIINTYIVSINKIQL